MNRPEFHPLQAEEIARAFNEAGVDYLFLGKSGAILLGYPGTVAIGTNIPGDTGAFSNSLDNALSYLQTTAQPFVLPVFDTATGTGSNAQFHIVAFVYVKLVGFKTTGTQAARYLDLVFTKGVISGTCCATSGINTLVRAIRICDVNTLSPNTNDPRAC